MMSKADIQTIEKHAGFYTIPVIAEMIGKKPDAVYKLVSLLKIDTRKESQKNRLKARANGDIFYHGLPCQYGHTKRYTRSRYCVECQKIMQRAKRRAV